MYTVKVLRPYKQDFFLKMAILNTRFNLHAFSVKGWLPPPASVDFDSLPYPRGGGMIFFFCKNDRKGWDNDYKDPLNLDVLVLRHKNFVRRGLSQ